MAQEQNRLHMILRRIGPDPHEGGAQTQSAQGCPDIFEVETGEFAIIGKDITGIASQNLPAGASCGPDERIILIPRRTLVLAKLEIPDAL
jgi:hypothetical protein